MLVRSIWPTLEDMRHEEADSSYYNRDFDNTKS